MVRRRAPWFIVVLLFLAWAYGIYGNQWGETSELPSPDALPATLIYVDRMLRLEDIAEKEGSAVQWVLSPDKKQSLLDAGSALEALEDDEDFGEDAERALAVIRSELDSAQEPSTDLDDLTRAALENAPASRRAVEELSEKLRSGDAQWWDARVASRLLATTPNEPLAKALETYRHSDRRLFLRTFAANGIVWLLSIIGLAFIPHMIRVIRSGWTIASLHRPVRYGSRWEPSLVIALFLAGDLIANYFITGAYYAAAYVETGFVFDVVVDAAWRLLAPAVALVILFRKPSHAIRSLGLDTSPSWKVVIGTFAFLFWLQTGYYMLIEPWSESDATGGLDMMENGWGGLVYGLLSAVILAPIAEEIFYRGLLLRGLERRFGFWISVSVATIAFALAHSYDAFGLISVGLVGFVLAVIYRTTGSLTTTILIHALYNLSITVPQWLMFHDKP